MEIFGTSAIWLGGERKKKEFTTEFTEETQRTQRRRRGKLRFGGDREVLHGVVGFDEAAEAFHDGGAVEKFAEELDFFAEFLVGDGLDKFFSGDAGFGVELGDLLGHGAGDFERVAFAGQMRDEPGLISGFGFDGAAGEEQIADEAVANVAAEAWNSAEAGNEAEAQLGETEARHFVRDDEIAEESEFEAAAHTEAVNSSKRDERRGVDGIGHAVDALDEFSEAGNAFLG